MAHECPLLSLAFSKGLRDARERKLNGVAIQAIAEQVEYLHVLQGAKAASAKNGSEVFQEDVTVRVDRSVLPDTSTQAMPD